MIEIAVSLIQAEEFTPAPTERDRWGLVKLDKHEWCPNAIPGHIIYCWTPGRYADAKREADLDWKAHFLQSETKVGCQADLCLAALTGAMEQLDHFFTATLCFVSRLEIMVSVSTS